MTHTSRTSAHPPGVSADDGSGDRTASAVVVPLGARRGAAQRSGRGWPRRRRLGTEVWALVADHTGSERLVFEASEWFDTSDDDELVALAIAGWANDAADDLAYWAANEQGDDDVLALIERARPDGWFEVVLDAKECVAWVTRHRPHLLAEIPPDCR